MELHYYVQYARELVTEYENSGEEKYIRCLANEMISYARNDPFSEFIATDNNAQSVIEIDNTIRSLAYLYKDHKTNIGKKETLEIDRFFVDKTNQLSDFFNKNKHAKLYKNWHSLTKVVVGELAGHKELSTDGFEDFSSILNSLTNTMKTDPYDAKGYMASYYKATINSLVAMAELSKQDLYSDGRLHDAVNKLLLLDKGNKSELFISVPNDFFSTSEMPNEVLSEVSDNVFRMRYEFDHKTNMAWLTIYRNKFPTPLIVESYNKYSTKLLEEHVGFR